MTLVANFHGGPGSGKSTTAAGVFHRLKRRGISCELIPEFAKEVVWEGREHLFDNQIYIFAKQHKHITQVLGEVDVALVDSPLLQYIAYLDHYDHDHGPLDEVILAEYEKMNNLDIFLERPEGYESTGRYQSAEEAREIDEKIRKVVLAHSEDAYLTEVDEEVTRICRQRIEARL